MDIHQLHQDICDATEQDSYATDIISALHSDSTDSRWSYSDGFLRRDGHIWVPNANDL